MNIKTPKKTPTQEHNEEYILTYSSFRDDVTAYLRFQRRHYDTPR